jgi:hypothetical protein
MFDDPSQKKPNANPKDEGCNHGKDGKGAPAHRPRVTAVQIYSAIAGVFALFAGIVFNIHSTPIVLEVSLCFVTVMFLGIGFRIWLQNNHKRKLVYNGWFAIVIILGACGCAMLWTLELKEKQRPQPDQGWLSVYPGESINKKEPFGTKFIFHNTGPTEILNVSYCFAAAQNIPKVLIQYQYGKRTLVKQYLWWACFGNVPETISPSGHYAVTAKFRPGIYLPATSDFTETDHVSLDTNALLLRNRPGNPSMQ